MKTTLLTLVLVSTALTASFGQSNGNSAVSSSPIIRIDSINSAILKRKVPTTIILPPNYDSAKTYPVFYLLHRWAGSNQSFIKSTLVTELTGRQLIVVTPSADTSWYVNAVANSTSRYEDFMTQELFPYLDKQYKANPTHQAIGGYSMGGFGALQIGLKHSERFTFIADISGAINPPFQDIPLTPNSPLRLIMNSVRVSFGNADSPVSTGSNVFRLVNAAPPSVFIYMAVGKQDEFDFIIPQHQLFVDALKKRGIAHRYVEYEGGHFDGKVLTACLPSLLDKLMDTLK